jgi:tetratricopeptide (TPR) repeat protein
MIGDPSCVSATRIACRPLALVLLALVLSTDGWAATKWIHLKSAHLEAVSDASENDARSRMVVLERVRGVLPEGLFGLPVSGLPTRVLLLKDGALVDRIIGGKRSSRLMKVDGGYISQVGENLILMDLVADRRNQGRVSQHEFIHLLMREQSVGWPLWLSEGVAQCFEQIEFKDGKAVFGMARPGVVEELRGTPFLPWRDLMQFNRRQLLSLSAENGAKVYSQSWLLTHFLLYGQPPTQRPKLERFFDLVDRRTPTVEALKQAFGWEPEDLKSELQKYMKSGRFYTLASDVPADLDLGVQSTPAPAGMGEAWIASFENFAGRAEVARKWLAEARKAAGDTTWTAFVEGELAYEAGDRKAAAAAFRRAVALDGDRVQARFCLARSLYPAMTPPLDEDLEEISTQLEAVVGRFPGHDVAWGMLGHLELRRKRLDKAGEALSQCLKLNPRDWVSRYNLAIVRGRSGLPDVALSQLQNVVDRAPNPELVNEARNLMKDLQEFIERRDR